MQLLIFNMVFNTRGCCVDCSSRCAFVRGVNRNRAPARRSQMRRDECKKVNNFKCK